MSDHNSITATCTPRADVLGGGLTDAHYAAQLDRNVLAPHDYTTYGRPEAFFELARATPPYLRAEENRTAPDVHR